MKFLDHLAHIIRTEYKQPREVVVVFPNRRAGLFLRNILKAQTEHPMWSPDIVSFQDLVNRESSLKLADPLQLVHLLYQVYRKHLPVAGEEGFERFYYWGKMLLKDFDEIDKYLVNGEAMYRNLMYQKELDMMFDFLSDEQKSILQTFWQGFENSRSENRERFLATWEKLGDIYREFRELLLEKGLAYEGLMYRLLAENIGKHEWKYERKHVLFAGFNALTAAEDRIISWCREHGDTRIEWDADTYYMEGRHQEAGRFLRMYRKRPVYMDTFPDPLPDKLAATGKHIEVIGVSQYVGQARIAGQKLGELIAQNPGIERHKIAIVLADESLLLPVLHALPENAGSINVTMGFPLSFAPVNSLIEYLSELQQFYREDRGYYYSAVLGIMRHSLTAAHLTGDHNLDRDIEKRNIIYVAADLLRYSRFSRMVFRPAAGEFLEYIIGILQFLEMELPKDDLNRTFIHHYRRHFVRYMEIVGQEKEGKVSVHEFRRLFRQLANTEKVPFTGEPLQGLQIMGVLETRNLDFDHIFMLSCNEGNLPSGASQHSFIPYNIRKAYELPHFDQQDAMYAYLFYRLLQGAKSAVFTWDTEGNDFGEEEMSRFLKQLIYEFPAEVSRSVLSSSAGIMEHTPLTIQRSEVVAERLSAYLEGTKGLSPSALNTYLECRLRFYFKYVARLYEPDEVEEDVDARSLGNILHKFMEAVYTDYIREHGHVVEEQYLSAYRKKLSGFLEPAFREAYALQPDDRFRIEGKNRIAGEIILEFASKILKRDEDYAPFEIVGLEEVFQIWEEIDPARRVRMFGAVDRVDRKDGNLRIIDYKTGKDNQDFVSIEGLFGEYPNKAAFQTILYTLLYTRENQVSGTVTPHVFNRGVIFRNEDSRFRYGPPRRTKTPLDDIGPFIDEYVIRLHSLLEEIFFSDTPFDQTEDIKKCEYCDFNVICQRAKE